MYKVSSVSLKISLLAFAYLFSINSKSLAQQRDLTWRGDLPLTLAQVTTDGTVNTQVNQNGNNAEITGGETRGNNLFHSFQDFSVPTGNEAFFNNANEISNIFSRVTGGNISNIDGLIRANDANLFLINPAGILFGAGARLDLGGGSFYGSSADSILFEDGEFSATDLDNPPLLTVNAPIGLNFRDNPADITVRGDGNGSRLADSEIIDTQDALRVDGNATIGFIGGNLNFASATVKTAGGRIELGSIAGGRVDLVEVANGFSFDYSGVEAFRDISLSGTSSVIDASGNGGGDINIAGRNISINDSSGIEANTLGDEAGGEINVFATDAIEISGVENENNFISAISNQVFSNATADGGDINIETGSLSIGDRAAINTSSSGQGNAGNININATNSVSIEGGNNSTSITTTGVNGNSGNIDINTGFLNADNGILFASHSGQGNAGNISIDTTGDINLLNNSVLSTSGTDGNSGNIEINANSLTVSDSSLAFVANSLGTGIGGNMAINATNNISFSNASGINLTGSPGGQIEVNAKNFSLTSGSILFAGTAIEAQFSNVISGDIVINLSEGLVLDGANDNNNNNNFLTNIDNSNRGQGNAGKILINARNISVLNGARITSLTLSDGNIGDIILNATEEININGSNDIINSSVSNFIASEATGNSGQINVSAQNLTLTDGGSIQSSVAGRANSGNINLDVVDTITIDGFAEFISTLDANRTFRLSSQISSTVGLGAVGNSGDINIDTKNLFISRNSEISTDIVQAEGVGGDININAEQITIGEQESPLLLPSNISSSTIRDLSTENFTEAIAGNIEINTGSLFIREGAEIDASTSNLGNAGNITINATDVVSVSGNSILIAPDGEEVEGFSNISNDVILDGIGDAGDLTINTSELIVDGGRILSSTNGQGDAGNITLNASRSLTANNEGIVGSSVINGDNTGNGGNLEINTSQLSISNESQINAFTRGQGNAGSININVDNLSIENGSINAFTEGEGNAGNITISANEFIQLSNNSDISAGTRLESTGNSSDLTIETKRLNVNSLSQIDVTTFGEGNAGNLTINASESIELSGTSDDDGSSGLFAGALVEDGNGGNLQISTADLTIRDGAIISVSNFPSVEGLQEAGTGEAGNLTVEADSLQIEDGGRINAATQAGDGGNITLDIAENITLKDSSFISAQALNDANGGNINIDTNFIIAFPNGNNDIIANAERGNGGNITINAESLFGIQPRPLNNSTNDINASSEFSLDGSVTINTPDLNSFQGETDLPQTIITPEQTTAQACSGNRGSIARNSFTIKGKGGIPVEPGLPLNSQNIFITGESSNSISATPQGIETSQGKIQPARGIKVTESGKIVLTAYRTNNSGERILEIQRNCG